MTVRVAQSGTAAHDVNDVRSRYRKDRDEVERGRAELQEVGRTTPDVSYWPYRLVKLYSQLAGCLRGR